MPRAPLRALALGTLFVIVATALPSDAAVTGCEVQVVLKSSRPDARVSEFAAATVTVNGNVTLAKFAFATGRIVLGVSTDPHRDASLSPGEFEVGQGERFEFPFVVNVTIPPTQSAHSGAQVVVSAKPEMLGVECGTALAQMIAGADEWYGAITGAASPAVVTLSSAVDRASISLNITQTTNDDLPPVQALVSVAVLHGFTVSAPRLVNMTGEAAGRVAATFDVAIERNAAPPGAYDLVVQLRSNAHGLSSNLTAASVDVVVRIVVEARLEILQGAAAAGIGAGALVAFGLWMTDERRRRGGEQ